MGKEPQSKPRYNGKKLRLKNANKIENQNRERFTDIKSSFFEKNNELTRLMTKKNEIVKINIQLLNAQEVNW